MKTSQACVALFAVLSSLAGAQTQETPADAEKPKAVTSLLDSIDVEVVGPSKVQRDAPIDYKVTVHNRGSADADNVVIEAVLTEQFRVTTSNPSAEKVDDRLIWKVAKVRAGATVELAFSAVAQSTGAGRVRAFARLDADPKESDEPPELPEPTPQPTHQQKGLQLRIDAPERVRVGEAFTCEAVLTNQTGKVVENGGFGVKLSKGLKLRETPSAATGPLRLESGSLIRVPLALLAESSGVQGIRAQVEADGGLKVDAEREIRVEQTEFGIQIDLPKQHVVGQPLKIRLYVANNRDAAAADVQVGIEIPESVEIVSGEAGALFNRRTRTVRWRAGDMQSNEERGFRLTVRPTTAGEIEFVATAQSSSGLSARNARRVSSSGHAALGVAVEPNADVVAANDLLTVVFDVRSRGSQSATGVILKLDKSPGFSIEAERSSGWREIDGTWQFQAPRDVPPGESVRSTVTLRALAPGDYLLKATTTSNDVVGEIIRTQPIHVIPAPPPIPESSPAPSAN